ncbi:MAG TPA: hypothetical protein DEF85_04770 [Clostridiaceae bacterium]|jgi:uncharacterized membrane protein|nr:hypothetical protein [Clostridiaceae bacterium]HBN29347.1 hypothetical protein [Clostridiaceae bacterium]HBX48187.1 hypothetical protein [Clostridiaceae bacterium]HCL50198.1 hypothetical protein [Clostridiaceae bacterium]
MDKKRIWEVDALRFIAIILMLIYHLVFDLKEYLNVDVNYEEFHWYIIGISSAIIFMFISGVSSGLSKNPIKRGVQVLACGMLVTLVSFIFFKDMYIRFGILHFLGVCMIISPALRKMDNLTLLLIGLACVITGIYIENITINIPYLLPLGFKYRGFHSFDYYPLIPYLSVYILGILVFRNYYKERKSIFKKELYSNFIRKISEKSLFIYLIHQPIYYALILLYKYVFSSL